MYKTTSISTHNDTQNGLYKWYDLMNGKHNNWEHRCTTRHAQVIAWTLESRRTSNPVITLGEEKYECIGHVSTYAPSIYWAKGQNM